MRGFILRVIINAIVLAVITAGWLPGIRLEGGSIYGVLLGVALIFGLVNGLIKPLVNLLTCALTLITLGIFRLVVNGAMLLLTAALSQWAQPVLGGRLVVDGLLWAIVGAVVASIVGTLLEGILDVDGERERRDEDWW